MNNLALSIEHNGITVRSSDNGEMLNLTDMWKACGSDPSKRPVDWQRKEGAAFIEFIGENIKVPTEHLFQTEKGRNGSTSAHWQIAMAYAKYLSHEFHAKCNAIVRAFMEGKLVGELSPKEKFLERLVLSLPKSREKQWNPDVIRLIAQMLRQPEKSSTGRAPVWLGSVTARLSKMRFGKDVHQAIKELAEGSGARHYEHMSDETIHMLRELQNMVIFSASQHGTWDDAMRSIQKYCDFTNGLGAQLALPGGNVCSCGHSLDGHARFCPECGQKVREAA